MCCWCRINDQSGKTRLLVASGNQWWWARQMWGEQEGCGRHAKHERPVKTPPFLTKMECPSSLNRQGEAQLRPRLNAAGFWEWNDYVNLWNWMLASSFTSQSVISSAYAFVPCYWGWVKSVIDGKKSPVSTKQNCQS